MKPSIEISDKKTFSQKLNDYYKDNLKKFDSMIVEGDFCDDYKYKYIEDGTAGSSGKKSYYSAERLNYNQDEITPSLLCKNAKSYISKIGLISIDELILSGFIPNRANNCYSDNDLCTQHNNKYNIYDDNKINNNGFLRRNNTYYTSSYDYILNNDNNNYYISNIPKDTKASLYPVINVKSSLKVNTGTGTKDDPYILVNPSEE